MRITYALPLTALLAVVAGTAFAASPSRGEQLHGEHCTGCHTSMTGGDPNAIYTRKDRRVTSLEGLRKQVNRCELSQGLKWFDEDVASVVTYLNDNFYRFSP